MLAVLAVSYASSARAWLRQRGEIADLTAQITSSREQIRQLEQEKRRWSDPAYIKAQAGRRFGWVMPGETGYRVIGDDGQTLSDGTGGLADPVPNRPGDGPEWWDAVWGSVVAAGSEGEAPDSGRPSKDPATKITDDGDASAGR